jgi:RNA polymerase-binding transcription factor DksA
VSAYVPQDEDSLVAEEYHTLLRTAERLLDDVDRALAALDDGSYGTCEMCGNAIDARDLHADPLVTRCIEHRVTTGP